MIRNRATSTPTQTAPDHVGGPLGFVYSTIPVVVFIAADAFLSLPLTIAVSVAVAVALAVSGVRLLSGERLGTAAGGLLGLAVAVGVVSLTGNARDFSAIGIWLTLAGFAVTYGSVLARRSLTGVVWNAVHGGTHAWRADRSVLHTHDVATLAAAAVLGSRFAAQRWLDDNDATGWPAVATIATGPPLTVLAELVVVRAFRRSTTRLAPDRHDAELDRAATTRCPMGTTTDDRSTT